MLILDLLEDEQGLSVGILLTRLMNENYTSFYIVFTYYYASTLPFTNK